MPAATTPVVKLSADLAAGGEVPIAELRMRLGQILGLPGPAPREAVLRALDDPAFETDLIVARGAPGFVRALLDHPRTRAYAAPEDEPAVALQSNGQLVAKAAGAVARWAKSGFAGVDIEVLTRREDACLACPHLSEPYAGVHKLAMARTATERVGSRAGPKVCGKCGCGVSRKIRLGTESCPDAHPEYPGLTRWGEPTQG